MVTASCYVLHGFFIDTYMFVCYMLHIKKTSCAAFQRQQHPAIASKIRDIQMYNSAAFDSWLLPIERDGRQPTCYRRETKSGVFTDLEYCLLAMQVHIPYFFLGYFSATAEAMSTRQALVSLNAFALSVLLYNGGIACRAFFLFIMQFLRFSNKQSC